LPCLETLIAVNEHMVSCSSQIGRQRDAVREDVSFLELSTSDITSTFNGSCPAACVNGIDGLLEAADSTCDSDRVPVTFFNPQVASVVALNAVRELCTSNDCFEVLAAFLTELNTCARLEDSAECLASLLLSVQDHWDCLRDNSLVFRLEELAARLAASDCTPLRLRSTLTLATECRAGLVASLGPNATRGDDLSCVALVLAVQDSVRCFDPTASLPTAAR